MKTKIIRLLSLFLLVFTSCQKEDLKTPVSTPFGVSVIGTDPTENFQIEGGSIFISEITIEGNRIGADDILISKEIEKQHLFSAGQNTSMVNFDLLTGEYSSLKTVIHTETNESLGLPIESEQEIEIESEEEDIESEVEIEIESENERFIEEPSLIFTGSFENSGVSVPVRFEIDGEIVYTANYSPSENFNIAEGTPPNFTFNFNPANWIPLIANQSLIEAEKTFYDGDSLILINKKMNVNLFQTIAAKIDESIELVKVTSN